MKNSEKYGKLAENCAKNNSKFNCEAKGSFGNKIQLLRRKEFEIVGFIESSTCKDEIVGSIESSTCKDENVGSIESSTCKDEITSSSSIQYQREKFVSNKNFIKTTDKITYPEELKEGLVTIGIMIYIVEKKKQLNERFRSSKDSMT